MTGMAGAYPRVSASSAVRLFALAIRLPGRCNLRSTVSICGSNSFAFNRRGMDGRSSGSSVWGGLDYIHPVGVQSNVCGVQ